MRGPLPGFSSLIASKCKPAGVNGEATNPRPIGLIPAPPGSQMLVRSRLGIGRAGPKRTGSPIAPLWFHFSFCAPATIEQRHDGHRGRNDDDVGPASTCRPRSLRYLRAPGVDAGSFGRA